MSTAKQKETPAQRIKRLEKLLEDEKLKNTILNGMIDIMDNQYGTGLRKKYLSNQSKKDNKTTFSKHWLRKHPNLFKDLILTRPEQAFVSDITYIKSRERTHYLSLVTDAHSRKIMGYHLSDDISAENVVKALKMAFKERQSTQPLIHHSDRGLQYCSSLYQQELNKYDVLPSMTDGYDCYQNALAERINGILKQEFLTETCNTGQELELLIKESVEVYNNYRPHLSLNMKTPRKITPSVLIKFI